jgi:hypothetical protein
MHDLVYRETAVNFLDRHIVTDLQNAEPIEVGHKSECCFQLYKFKNFCIYCFVLC